MDKSRPVAKCSLPTDVCNLSVSETEKVFYTIFGSKTGRLVMPEYINH
jgi:hypothetical protein